MMRPGRASALAAGESFAVEMELMKLGACPGARLCLDGANADPGVEQRDGIRREKIDIADLPL